MRYLGCIIILYVSLPLWASECLVDPLARYTQLGGDAQDEKIRIQAEHSEGDFSQVNFSGSVSVQQGDIHLLAPNVNYQDKTGEIRGKEGLIIGMPQAAVQGKEGTFNTQENIVSFKEASYYLAGENNANGNADNAIFNRRTNKSFLENVVWTTCNRISPVWQLNAKKLTLDNNKNRGIARDVTFRIKDVPVLYLPYFSFPLNNQRTSGILTPSILSSDKRGIELKIPYYWNIAPNQDATFTFNPMSRRGVAFEGQYRFLTKNQTGTVDGTWLFSDKKYANKQRWNIGIAHQYKINSQWETDLKYQDVSDIDYLGDMQRGLQLYEDWYIERSAALYGNLSWGNVTFRVQDYKRVNPNVDDNLKPFGRIPQLLYENSWQNNGFTFNLTGEAVRFQKDRVGRVNRFRSNGELGYRINRSYGYLEPKLSLDTSYYQFFPENHAFRDGRKLRVLPTFSLDGELIFERDTKINKQNYTQTIEPRLFYLYTPYRNQKDIPILDTSELSRSWYWLFARNRFTGGDRISDANQLTTAITTRLYRNNNGQEQFKLSLGQIQYFTKRKVMINQKPVEENDHSVLFLDGKARLGKNWQLYSMAFWDPGKNKTDRNVLDLNYYLDADRYAGIGYSYVRNEYNQISVSGGWRINPEWRIFARQDYSLRHNQRINTLFGVEYNDCCWAWRFVGRQYRDKPDARKIDNSIYLEFIFKGLGNIGSSTSSLLSNQLNNFQPLPQEKPF